MAWIYTAGLSLYSICQLITISLCFAYYMSLKNGRGGLTRFTLRNAMHRTNCIPSVRLWSNVCEIKKILGLLPYPATTYKVYICHSTASWFQISSHLDPTPTFLRQYSPLKPAYNMWGQHGANSKSPRAQTWFITTVQGVWGHDMSLASTSKSHELSWYFSDYYTG